MIWSPDGKIWSKLKCCNMEKMRQAMGTRWEKGFVKLLSEIQLQMCHLFKFEFVPSFSSPSIPFICIHSFVLLCSLHFSSSLSFDLPCECSWGFTFSHLLEEKCGSLTCLKAAPWRPCADLYVCACEIYSHLSHHFIWYSAGGHLKVLYSFFLDSTPDSTQSEIQKMIRTEWTGQAMINEAKGLHWITIS